MKEWIFPSVSYDYERAGVGAPTLSPIVELDKEEVERVAEYTAETSRRRKQERK